ncbi:MAG: NAD-dependent epimerase/dehydratase family protein [Hyphomicrobiales bacterium]
MTILVTGSSGHLGEAVMRRLRSEQQPALGIDIVPCAFTDAVGSICDRDFVKRRLAGVRAVIHSATLHKPHVATHANRDFVETNIAGTLTLLEEAAEARVEAFVFTSTTSAFGSALTPAAGEPASWVTEDVTPVPKNIYGVTKVAAENLCELFFRRRRLPVIVLRTSRFFPETDDEAAIREKYFRHVLESLHAQVDFRSELARQVGSKGYHATVFEHGPYPVA